ncbi:MAG: type 4a pilus biogenesis protein PilO [Bacillota bacterium]
MKGKAFSGDKLSVILLIILVVLSLYLSLNRYSSLGEVRERLRLEQQALARDEAKLRLLLELREKGPLFLEQLEHFNNLIPEEANVHHLLPYLQRTAFLNQASLLQVHFVEEKASGDYVELPLTLSFEGSFHELLKLLRSLREGERAVRIDSIRLVQGGEALAHLRAELNASVFYRK